MINLHDGTNFYLLQQSTFDDKKKFSIDFSNEDSFQVIVFNKNKDYYITSMACYVDLTVDITRLPNYAKIEQTSDLANALLRDGVDLDIVEKN